MTMQTLESLLAAYTGGGNADPNLVNLLTHISNATPIGQDRIVRKEVSLGIVRTLDRPIDHKGDLIAPFLEVAADDVIFDYLTLDNETLAPARAEDAESELAQKDTLYAGQGRASVIDWALKSHYDASDVNRAREIDQIAQQLKGANGVLPLVISSAQNDFQGKVARDRIRRRKALDNRREKLIMDSVFNGTVLYNDGKIKFATPWGRPANQSASDASFDLVKAGIVDGVWDISGVDFDPITFFNELNSWFFDLYGVHLKGCWGSKKLLNSFWRAQKFSQRAGLGAVYDSQGNAGAPDLLYATAGWSPQAARRVIEETTGFEFVEYDAIYRTRAVGSQSFQVNRFSPVNRLVFFPDPAEMAEIAATEIGFAKTLTSPHPEGNFTPSYYEWEQSTKDPWGQDVGNGIKMYPVFPHMEYTVTVDVNLPA